MRVLLLGGSGFIGTRLARKLLAEDFAVRVFDIRPPDDDLKSRWCFGDILNLSHLLRTIHEFAPTHVVNLAAETDADTKVFPPDPRFFTDFPVNLYGAENLIAALSSIEIHCAVFFSTSFVHAPSANPLDTAPPHTPYGYSKATMEKRVVESDLPWVILRPTYVWGGGPNTRFLKLAESIVNGHYLHPGGNPIVRSYGYVGTIADQTARALQTADAVHKTLYVGDAPIDSGTFVDALSVEFRGRPARRVPRQALRLLAAMVDSVVEIPFDRFRYRHMTTDFVVDMKPTWELLGYPSTSFEESVKEFGRWYRSYESPRGGK